MPDYSRNAFGSEGTRCRPWLRVAHERMHDLRHNRVCRMTREQLERFMQLPPDYRIRGGSAASRGRVSPARHSTFGMLLPPAPICAATVASWVASAASAGGFTMLLRELCPQVPIRSYDVRTSPHQTKLTTAGIDARTADVFCPLVLGEIAQYVRQPGRSVILCDGGNKPAELRQIAKIAKPGDLILAHDYACDRDYFRREMLGGRWDWCEITDADWQPQPNLRKLPREDLARVVWLVTEVQTPGVLPWGR